MPRHLSSAAVLILGGLALAIGGGPFGASAQQPEPDPEPAQNVSLTVYTNQASWRTLPSVVVQGQLRNADGTARANGFGFSDDQGNVTVNFGGGGGGGFGGGNQGNNMIRPGDEIRFSPSGGDTFQVDVPNLRVGADEANGRIIGSGPAGETLDLAYGDGTTVMTGTLSVDGTGAFAYDMPAGEALDPGTSGSVSMTDADNNTFTAAFHVLEVNVTLGARSVSGDATMGTQVEVAITGGDGSDKGSRDTNVWDDTDWQVQQGGGFGGPGGGGPGGGGQQNPFGPIAAGDTITVENTNGVAGTDQLRTGIVPGLEIEVNLGARTADGTGPADSEVEVTFISPYDEEIERAAPTDAAGAFSIDMSDVADFGRGWRVRARAEFAPGMRVSAFDVVEQVRVGVHSSVVNGVADPGQVVTITVKAPDGTVKGQGTDGVNGQGNFSEGFGGDETIEFGDLIEVEFVAGDPVVVIVSEVTAQTDPAADTVGGLAPPDTSVRVSRSAGGQQSVVTTTPNASGRYEADFSGQLDIEAPMNGSVVVRLGSGHELFTTWAAVRMTIELGQTVVTGNGPAGRDAFLELVDPQGTVVATAQDGVGGGGGGFGPGGGGPGGGGGGGANWFANFEDTLGQPVEIEPGDTVRATVGDDRFDVVVPPLAGISFPSQDIINGTTEGARDVTVTVQRPLSGETQQVETAADGNGFFTADFTALAEPFDLLYNDNVLFSTLEVGHVVNSRFTSPGLVLNLDTAVLSGNWRPSAQLLIELRRGGRSIFTDSVTTGEDASFGLILGDDAQNRLLPQTGDEIVVQPLDAGATDTLTFEVPEVVIEWDEDANTVGGRVTPGGFLNMNVLDAIWRIGGGGGGFGGGGGGGRARNDQPEIGPDGSFTVDLSPGNYQIRPGVRMQAFYRVPVGHLVLRNRYVPLVNVQHGGGNVCGFTDAPRVDVTARLDDAAGAQLAATSGTSGYNSEYRTTLETPAGEVAITEAGQSVTARLGDRDITVALPEIQVDVNWGNGFVQGQGPAGAFYNVLRPARSCLDTQGRPAQRGTINQQGNFIGFVPGGLDPGEGVEIAIFDDAGHRVYRHVFRALGQVFIDQNRVQGRATPSSPVEVTLLAPDGTERASAETVSTEDGFFIVALVDGAGAPVIIDEGDTVRLDASGETPEIEVERLRFDWSPGDPVIGETTPDRDVQITLNVAGVGNVSFTLESGADGSFRFMAADIPPRTTWTLGDVLGARAVIDTENEHQIVFEAGDIGGPVAPPVDGRTNRILLPISFRNQ